MEEEEGGIYMDTRYLMAKLSKDQCLAFLALAKNAPLKKSELVEQLLAHITQQDQEMQRLLAMFPYELAVEPTELAELLHCSRSERRLRASCRLASLCPCASSRNSA